MASAGNNTDIDGGNTASAGQESRTVPVSDDTEPDPDVNMTANTIRHTMTTNPLRTMMHSGGGDRSGLVQPPPLPPLMDPLVKVTLGRIGAPGTVCGVVPLRQLQRVCTAWGKEASDYADKYGEYQLSWPENPQHGILVFRILFYFEDSSYAFPEQDPVEGNEHIRFRELLQATEVVVKHTPAPTYDEVDLPTERFGRPRTIRARWLWVINYFDWGFNRELPIQQVNEFLRCSWVEKAFDLFPVLAQTFARKRSPEDGSTGDEILVELCQGVDPSISGKFRKHWDEQHQSWDDACRQARANWESAKGSSQKSSSDGETE